jgi:hypothetical protein
MYYRPPNSIEFKRGYSLGIQKGRLIERKFCLIVVIGFVSVFEIIHAVLERGCK